MIGNPLKITDLISEMSQGGIRIPEIQRSYVWKRSQISKLLDSIYHGYPSGSILLWDTMEQIIMREMRTNIGQGKKYDFIPKIVLDGQQRLTSLGRIFDRSTPRDDRIIFNVVDEIFEPYSPRNASDPRWLDVTEVLTDELTELDVIDKLQANGVVDPDDREKRNEIHNRLRKLTRVKEYQFPVEIVKEDDLEIVTEVFIRVNSAGTRLREAELALARLAWKMPGSIVGPFEHLQDACEERGFEIDGRFLMRALISVATRQSRFRDLKAFWDRPVEDIEKAWKRTEKGIKLTLDFVEGNVGFPGSELLPSHLSLIPVCAVFSQRETLNGGEEQSLRRWFLLANSFSRYVGASETTLNQDLSTLGPRCENVSGLLEQLIRDLRGEPHVTADDLVRAATNSPFFPLAYLAVIRRDAQDWFKGIKVRRESFSEDQLIEYHHIFPRKLLNERGVDRYIRDEIANLAFLAQRANRKIRARRPADYLPEIAEQDRGRLEAQFVPMDRALWELDRFEEFLAARRHLLANAMNEVLET